jgi:hypothetical protein
MFNLFNLFNLIIYLYNINNKAYYIDKQIIS